MLDSGIAGADFRRIAAVPITGRPMLNFDISWVDRRGQFYYLADRSNAAVHIIDARDNTYVARVTGFVGIHPEGNPRSGPNGVLVIESQHEAWVSDGDSTVKVIDLRTMQVGDPIDTSRQPEPRDKRADEMAYDPRNHILMVANNEDSPPFLSFIDTRTHEVLGRLDLPEATDGLEQPVYDRRTGKFLQAVPETKASPGGEIAIIDPVTRQLDGSYSIPVINGRRCSPHGLDLGPRHELLIGCSRGDEVLTLIMDAGNGEIVKVFTEVGASDQVWFNPSDGLYFLAARNFPGGAVLGIIDSEKNEWVANIPTAPSAHSVAASRRNDEVFVPFTPVAGDPECSNGCIAIFADDDN